jgi:mannose-6-phosphate isomerase-like protein (cupin superfamily)
MSEGRHFCFEGLQPERVIAHGGAAAIWFQRVARRGDGLACNFIDLSVLPVGADIGLHTHTPDNEEIYIVISGRGLMTLDGRQFEVGPGHVIVNRPGGTHGLRNVGDVELRLVVLEVPTAESRAAHGPEEFLPNL